MGKSLREELLELQRTLAVAEKRTSEIFTKAETELSPYVLAESRTERLTDEELAEYARLDGISGWLNSILGRLQKCRADLAACLQGKSGIFGSGE